MLWIKLPIAYELRKSGLGALGIGRLTKQQRPSGPLGQVASRVLHELLLGGCKQRLVGFSVEADRAPTPRRRRRESLTAHLHCARHRASC